MLFKSHLAVLVLMLCGLHLTARADSYTAINITQHIGRVKEFADKDASQPNDTKTTTSATQPTNREKTAETTVEKTTQATTEEKPTHNNPPSPTTKHTSKDKQETSSIRQTNNKDKAPTTREKPKNLTKNDTTQHGGSSATIPSMFTIASLICVLLL